MCVVYDFLCLNSAVNSTPQVPLVLCGACFETSFGSCVSCNRPADTEHTHTLLFCCRVNQEKMKRHRETIIPPSESKDFSPGRKGRVAAMDTQSEVYAYMAYSATSYYLLSVT